MTTQQARAEAFKALHVPGKPVILFNIWDAGSARAVAEAGAKALATGSWSVAAAHGFADGEELPLELALANLRRIVASADLPVSLDLERGYGAAAADVGSAAAHAMAAGAIGFNLEDGMTGGGGLHPIDAQCERLGAVRLSAKEGGAAAFINARTDIFLNAEAAEHKAGMPAAIERAKAYAEAGADGFFAPGLIDAVLIAELCKASPLPVNIMMMAGAPPIARLAKAGVARVSHGPGPYRLAMKALGKAAHAAFAKL